MTRTSAAWILVGGVIVLLPPGGSCFAQSQPYVRTVQNSASFSRRVAQGSLFVAAGGGLGPSTVVQATAYPLTTELGGTSVKIVVGTTTVSCPMVHSSATQVAAILPSNTPTGDGTIVVTYNDSSSSPSFIRVVTSAFGVYSTASSGLGPGTITGLDYVTKTFTRPSKPGEVLVAWGTGLGPVTGGDSTIATPDQPFSGVEVFVGDRAAKVIYAGRSGCCAGLDQVAFEVPDIPQSCFVPVAVRTEGGTSNFVTIPISSSGGVCVNDIPGIPLDLISRISNGEQLTLGIIGIGPIPVLQGFGFRFSYGIAERISKLLRVKVPEEDVSRLLRAYRIRDAHTVRSILGKYSKPLKAVDAKTRDLIRSAVSGDQQGAVARLVKSSGFAFGAPQFAANFPATGTCMVTQTSPQDPTAKTRPLDAGASLRVESPAGRKTMIREPNGQYQAMLGITGPDHNTAPGSYTVSGTGGADIGAFSATMNIASSLVWTNKSAVANVDRTRPLTVTWSGGAGSGYVWIGGAAGSEPPGSEHAATVFTCVEESRKGMFTIPDFVLSALPDEREGTLFLSPHPLGQRIIVPGLDLAFLVDASSDSRKVRFR
ncbi:MAG: hypothetical protein IT165_27000 [Bryobacterales bacterium]|nr:hypothetical protein [Bryobacterales bacterium]